jgi:hypothetical protein
LAVLEAAVQLFADIVRQAGYFSYSAHVGSLSGGKSGMGGGTKAVQCSEGGNIEH